MTCFSGKLFKSTKICIHKLCCQVRLSACLPKIQKVAKIRPHENSKTFKILYTIILSLRIIVNIFQKTYVLEVPWVLV